MKTMPKRVKMVDVGPRDGLQNEPGVVPTDAKVELVDRLSDAGLPAVEATSFVSPKWVPQMADAAEVMARIRRKPGVSYPVLVPNMKGLEAAMAARVEEIAVFGAATESFSRRNTNCSIAESFERFEPVCKAALDKGIKVRGYISVVLGCPYEGEVAPKAVADVARRLWDMGCYEISLGDTIGAGTPGKTQRDDRGGGRAHPGREAWRPLPRHLWPGDSRTSSLRSRWVWRASTARSPGWEAAPIRRAPPATWPREDVLYLLDGLGIETGVSMDRLLEAAEYICGVLGRPTHSRAGRAILAKRKREAKAA